MISEMSFDTKLVGLGGIIMAISVFLPWYQDLDAFKTGDMFLGITGPLYLIGVIMFLLGIITTLSVTSKQWQNRIARIGLDLPVAHIIIGAFNLFLLVLANSVYFHAKFGVNIMLKEFRFGMVFAFIGVGLMLIGGIFEYKKDGIKWENLKGENKPLIDIEETRKHGEVRVEHGQTAPHNVGQEIPTVAEDTNKDTRYPNL